MRASILNRKLHRWGAIVVALPVLLIFTTGLLLQLKKEVAWIQPATLRGSESRPEISFDRILEIIRTVPEAEIGGWEDVDRLDVRPGRGMLKVRSTNRWEVQLDSATGTILQVAYRRSDWIESLHDGSFFGVKLWIFLPTGFVLLGLWGTGLYLFFLPHLARRRRKRA